MSERTHRAGIPLGATPRNTRDTRDPRKQGNGLEARLDELLGAFASPDYATCQLAIAHIVELGPEVLEPLLARFPARPGDPWGRREVCTVEAFKRLGDARAVPALLERLGDPQPKVRLECLRGLRWLCREAPAFVACLGDCCWQVRREAIFALADLGGTVLGEAADEAKVAGDAGYAGSSGGELAVQGLLRCLGDDHYKVRASAANALGILRAAHAVPHLERMLEDVEAEVRALAAWSLRRLKSPVNVADLLKGLERAVGEERREVVAVLGGLLDAETAAPLVALLDDPESAVRQEAALALGRMGRAESVALLAEMVRTEPAERKQLAAWALAAVGAPAADALKALLDERDEAVRHHAVFALGFLNVRLAAEPLFQSIKSESNLVRSEARRALDRLKGWEAPGGERRSGAKRRCVVDHSRTEWK